MNYKLAKKLKKAGFPQKIKYGEWYFENVKKQGDELICNVSYGQELDSMIITKCPNLSELIEACGGKFAELQKNGSFTRYTPKTCKWIAWGISKDKNGDGETPEEAVANLWLETLI